MLFFVLQFVLVFSHMDLLLKHYHVQMSKKKKKLSHEKNFLHYYHFDFHTKILYLQH